MHELPIYGLPNREFPVASDLLHKKFIWFFHIGPPNDSGNMFKVAKVFHAVFERYGLTEWT